MFEPAGSGPVRLELPAEAFEGRGTFRFLIPAAMIADQKTQNSR